MSLRLRPLEQDDLRWLFELGYESEIERSSGYWPDCPTFDAFRKAKESLFNEIDKQNLQLVVEKDGERVGVVNASNIDLIHGRAEIGVVVDPAYRGQRLATPMIELIVEFLFNVRRMNKIYALIYPFNEKSRRAFVRAGFEIEVVLVEHDWHLGEYQDVAVYSLLRSRWKR